MGVGLKGQRHKMDIFKGSKSYNQYFLGIYTDGFKGFLTAARHVKQI
jgi:hypothetical protein